MWEFLILVLINQEYENRLGFLDDTEFLTLENDDQRRNWITKKIINHYSDEIRDALEIASEDRWVFRAIDCGCSVEVETIPKPRSKKSKRVNLYTFEINILVSRKKQEV